MAQRTFLQTFWELYQDQLSEKTAKMTIFFFKGIVVAAMILINIKIAQHLPFLALDSQESTYMINILLFAILLFVLEVMLIVVGVLLFDAIHIMAASVKRIQTIPRTEEELKRQGCNSRQSVALFYATQCYLYGYHRINDVGYSIILQLLSTQCAVFPLLCIYDENPDPMNDSEYYFRSFYNLMRHITVGDIDTFYKCIKPTTTTQFQEYMEIWLDKHSEI